MGGFYFTLGKFIKRLRAEHEDETNYKFVLNNYDKNTMITKSVNEGSAYYGHQTIIRS